MTTRRDFLLASGALLVGARPLLAAKPRALRVLVLGGTGFIGPHLVARLVARGHAVTIFTRGRRQADLPASVTALTGDRDGDLSALATGTWDAVIDDSSTRPERTRRTVELLKGRAGRYLFTSSTGVHYPYLAPRLGETAPVDTVLADPKDGSADYGVAKARSEQVVRDGFGDGALVVRPTYIVGPGDTSDRFPYWPQRLARGGETLAPGRADDAAQWIDVRDLAAFMVTLLEDGRAGTYEAAGPREPTTFRAFLGAANQALGGRARLVWVDDHDFLERHGVVEAIPWALPKGNDRYMMAIDNRKAVKAGLAFRPIERTVRDTLAWWETSVPAARKEKPRFTITPDVEAKALADWKAR